MNQKSRQKVNRENPTDSVTPEEALADKLKQNSRLTKLLAATVRTFLSTLTSSKWSLVWGEQRVGGGGLGGGLEGQQRRHRDLLP